VAVAPAPMQRQQVPFVVWVVDDGDRPMADATVRCWQEGREPTLRNTGADGRAGFAAVDRAGGLLVQASACMQVLQSLPHLVGEHRVVLGAGKRVAGQMLVDGKPAPAGLRLRLSGKPLASKAVLPPSIVELLQIWRPQSTTATDDSGHFAFHGLPSDWTGSLDLPLTHWLLPGPERDSCRLPAPCEDLIVATTHLQSVEGRVVWADTGEGVVEPEITVFGEFTDGDSSPGTSLTGDAHGCFGVGFGPGSSGKHDRWFDPARRTPIAHVQLTASARGSAGKTTVELDAEQLRAGDIVVRLQRAPTTHFLAVGKGGQPIAGARVLSNRASEPTGPDGRGVFIGPPDHLLVGAPGCQIMPAEPARPAAGTIDDPLVFVLVPGNRLVLRVRNTMGEVPILWEIVLRSRRNLFAGPANNAQTELHHLLGSSHMNGHWSDKQASAFAVLDDRGEVVLESLVPDQPFTVAVVDRLFTELLTQELVTPALGQSRELDLVIAARPRTLHGCVRARDGAPLRDPRIEGKVGDHSNRIEVAVDGTFALTQIYVQEPLTLVVRCPGFVSQVREGLTPEHDDQEVVFALEPAHKVTVQVLDEQDAAVPVGRVRVQGAGPVPIDEQELAPGEFTFADLPLGNVTFRCELGSHPFEVVHDTANERAVLRVPRPARVLVLPPEGVANSAASSFDAAVTRLDAAEEPMELALSTGNGAPPHLLLPGRYRFALVRWERRGGGIEHFEVGAAAEVELPAGVVTRVQLR
ncbi:MAG TPA: hypothetical protein VK348_04680, partial [Planctomycetota bacterium]|nr:hypothetical protein [Planctomycetota bacterium]